VGEDGRVRVTDFGVARAESFPSLETPAHVALPVQTEAWEQTLTMPGVVVGTPKYLAPEVLRGQPADARSDLFAFCVALYEALYDQPAFTGVNTAERLHAQRAGQVNPLPAQTPVPAWVGRAVLRGLAPQPHQRPASMQALVAKLEDDPEVRRQGWLRTAAVTAVVVGLAGLAVVGWVRQRQQGPDCGRMQERLAGIWDEAVQARVREAFAATGLPYAQDTATRVEAALDTYSGTWARQRAEVCEAMQSQGGSPRSLAVLQEYCLERRRSQLSALTEVLSRGADKDLVGKAVQAVQSLPPLEYCAEAKALTAAVPPPEDPALRARAEPLQQQVDRLEALQQAGKYKEALALGEGLLVEVQALGHAPLHARALYQVAELKDSAGDYKGAEALLREAILPAARGKDDVLASQIWSLLLMQVGPRQARHAEALTLEPMVRAAAERAEEDLARARALTSLGTLLQGMGQYGQAREHLEQALALQQQALGPEHPSILRALTNLGIVLEALGQHEQARTCQERALALAEKVLGPEHPHVAGLLNNLGNVLRELGQYEQARAHYERSLVLKLKVLGPEHPSVCNSYNNLGLALHALGQYEQALAQHKQALALKLKVLGPEHPTVADSYNNLAMTLTVQGRYEQAREGYEKALALKQKVLGPEHPTVADGYNNLGVALRQQGRYEQALQYYEKALALRRKALGPEHPTVAGSLNNLGTVLADMGRYEQAWAHLERSLALSEKALGPGHPETGDALLCMGDTLQQQGRYGQAREYHERALGVLEKAHGAGHPEVASAHASLGRTLVQLKRWDEAARHLEQARAVGEKRGQAARSLLAEALLGQGELSLARHRPAEAVLLLERALTLAEQRERPEVQWVLAQALWEEGRDRPRAHEAAAQAQGSLRKRGAPSLLAQVSRWLYTHRSP
jgi:eukaryotic-like serine/threonine-protein kinase